MYFVSFFFLLTWQSDLFSLSCLVFLSFTLIYLTGNVWLVGGWTYTGKALQLAYNQLFVAAKGARGNVAKVKEKKVNGIVDINYALN